MVTRALRGRAAPSLIVSALVLGICGTLWGQEPAAGRGSIVYKIQSTSERLEMTVNSSRILTMDQKIPQAQVNNPEVLVLTALSPTQVQISAKKPGVTQVNLWDEKQQIHTVDVIVFGDAQELTMLLQSQFPGASLRVIPVASGVLISGYVDQPEHISRIIQIAEEFYPKVLNNITVGGCQQVLLHVKIMEVSRSKLRQLGFDWAQVSGSNVVSSGPNGLLSDFDPTKLISPGSLLRSAVPSTFAFSVISGDNAFFGVLDALRQDNLAKIMAEPTLVTISGRPASFLAGGSFYIVPQGLAASQPISVDYGTQLDFVPIVLGNGRIHLDVRPKISQIDPSLSVQGYPGLLERKAETGVELQAGQTLAIAGLVQSRVEAERRGLPWISELPYLGAAFRRTSEKINEVELLILITPELVDAMDANEVPPCGPGKRTTSPTDWELFMRGYLEVPNGASGGAGCNQQCSTQGSGPAGSQPVIMPGMIDSPAEQMKTPQPAGPSRSSPQPGASGQPGPKASSPQRQPPAEGAPGAAPSNRNNPSGPQNRPAASQPSGGAGELPGYMGPIGYDAVQ
jgi:pilus assembly protein CpaC